MPKSIMTSPVLQTPAPSPIPTTANCPIPAIEFEARKGLWWFTLLEIIIPLVIIAIGWGSVVADPILGWVPFFLMIGVSVIVEIFLIGIRYYLIYKPRYKKVETNCLNGTHPLQWTAKEKTTSYLERNATNTIVHNVFHL